MLAQAALIIYSVAPKVMPNLPDECRLAHNYLRILWRGCDSLGMTDAIPGLNTPTAFPSAVDVTNPTFHLSAAKVNLKRRANQEQCQGFVFEYQDILGVLAMLETKEVAGCISKWKGLLDEWLASVGAGELPTRMMAETYLFTALHDSSNFSSASWLSNAHFSATVISDLGKEVIEALPGSAGALWHAKRPYISEAGYWIWGGEYLNGRRTVGLVAPKEKKDDLFRWTVWPDPTSLAPFARYVMHTAKLRFAQYVQQQFT